MTTQDHSTDDQLRVLVYSDPLSDIDKQDIRQYLTIALQLRYPTRRVVVELYSSLQSFGLNDRIGGIAQQVEFLAANKPPPYDWCLPFFFLQNERSIDERYPEDPWPLLCEQIATEADTIANHILLATVPYSVPKNRDFLAQVNENIVKLARTGARYLLDLDPLFSKVPSPKPGYANICCICDVVAKFIAGHQLGFDKLEDEVFDTLAVSQLDHVDPNAGEAGYRHSKPIVRARKYYRHGYTEAQLTDLRKTLEQRCVQHLETIQNIHNFSKTPKAKRTQTQGRTANMRITRPDRVHAETFIGASTMRLSDHEDEWTKENWPEISSGGSTRTNQHCPVFPSIPTSVSASGALNLRKPSDARYLKPNSTNKRTHGEAFNEIRPFSGEHTALPGFCSSASIPRPSNPLAAATVPAERQDSDLWPKPDLWHPAFSVSYQTGGRSYKESKKKGKMVVLKYTPKAKRAALAIPSTCSAQHRGSLNSLDRRSMLGQKHEEHSVPSTPIKAQNGMYKESHGPPPPESTSKRLQLSSDNSAQYIMGINGREYIDPLQHQVSEAALQAPYGDPRRTGRLSTIQRGDAGGDANPFELASLDDIPNFMFDPDFTAADVIRLIEDDLEHNNAPINSKARHLAQLTGTINPAALVTMTAEDIIEAHLPVLKGYQNVYPDIFKAPATTAAQNPLVPPILQVNGRMGRGLVPNPLDLSASRPGEYQSACQNTLLAPASIQGQAQPISPTPAPKVGLIGGAASEMLAIPSQAYPASPMSAGFLSKMHDDLRTMRNSPEPQNNSAHISAPLSRTPPGTSRYFQSPGMHAFAENSPHDTPQEVLASQISPQQGFGQTPYLEDGPLGIRQKWIKEAERNIKAGNCSFCGLAKDDQRCGHAIPSRPEPAKAEGEGYRMPDAWTPGDQAQDFPSQGVQLQRVFKPTGHQDQEEPTTSFRKETTGRPEGRKGDPKPRTPEPDPEQIANNSKAAELANGWVTTVQQSVEEQAQTEVNDDAQMLAAQLPVDQANAQAQSLAQARFERQDVGDTAAERPEKNASQKRKTRSDEVNSHKKPHKKTTKSEVPEPDDTDDVAQREASQSSVAPPSNDESQEEETAFGASNAEPRAQWQAHAQLLTPFMLSKVARMESERMYKMDPAEREREKEKARRAQAMISAGNSEQVRKPSAVDVVMTEAHRAFNVSGASGVASVGTVAGAPLPTENPETAFPFSVPKNPMPRARERTPLLSSRPQTPQMGVQHQPAKPESKPERSRAKQPVAPPLPSSVPRNPIPGAKEGTTLPPSRPPTPAPTPKAKPATGKPEPNPRPSRSKAAIAATKREKAMNASAAEMTKKIQSQLHTAERPQNPPLLQIDGGMRRDDVPNPLNIAAARPKQYQAPYQSPYQTTSLHAGQGHAKDLPISPSNAKSGMIGSERFGFLVPMVPSQTHLPSPISAGFHSNMGDTGAEVGGEYSGPQATQTFFCSSKQTAAIPVSALQTPSSTPAVELSRLNGQEPVWHQSLETEALPCAQDLQSACDVHMREAGVPLEVIQAQMLAQTVAPLPAALRPLGRRVESLGSSVIAESHAPTERFTLTATPSPAPGFTTSIVLGSGEEIRNLSKTAEMADVKEA